MGEALRAKARVLHPELYAKLPAELKTETLDRPFTRPVIMDEEEPEPVNRRGGRDPVRARGRDARSETFGRLPADETAKKSDGRRWQAPPPEDRDYDDEEEDLNDRDDEDNDRTRGSRRTRDYRQRADDFRRPQYGRGRQGDNEDDEDRPPPPPRSFYGEQQERTRRRE